MGNDNRRAHERIEFADPVRITKPNVLDGTGIDLSVGGVAVRVPTQIPQGTAVEIDLFGAGAAVAGTVRLSVPHAESGFRLGIQWPEEHPEFVAKWQAMRG